VCAVRAAVSQTSEHRTTIMTAAPVFRTVELDPDDVALREAQHSAIGVLAATAGRMDGSEQMSPSTLTVMA
jgi:hypothetical protein